MTATTLTTANRAASFLGWFSIGLGTLEAAAPGVLGRTLGLKHHSGLLRFYGLRELSAGASLLTQTGTPLWLWARVGGDALDIVTLALALNNRNPKRANAGVALASVLAITGLDLWTAVQLSRHEVLARNPTRLPGVERVTH